MINMPMKPDPDGAPAPPADLLAQHRHRQAGEEDRARCADRHHIGQRHQGEGIEDEGHAGDPGDHPHDMLAA